MSQSDIFKAIKLRQLGEQRALLCRAEGLLCGKMAQSELCRKLGDGVIRRRGLMWG